MRLNNVDDIIKTAEINTANDLISVKLIADFKFIIVF